MNDASPAPGLARIARGGKTVYGASLGVIMLETRFPRIPGDIGNGESWPFPVLFRTVPGATARRVVLEGAHGLLPDFIAAAQDLVALGADAITTSCGFLVVFQKEIAAAVGVPVATSALLQVPWVEALLPSGRRVGVITASRPSLSSAHFAAAGMAADTPVIGIEGGRELYRVLVTGEKPDLDAAAAEQDILDAGRALVAAHPEVGAIVLECTNMPPYAAALQDALGLPVHDVLSLGRWLQAGLRPRRFA
ncbi:aspartate/glutamate racemase family protein [Roseomonas sp. HF4]|uniref:aspartate/glutamate racemase family protein n=1 Tax=Roseomonas sp. HF4 TaxID=2562313 RepID=UPI0010BFB60C|nr:aspartate/glutamate racemase family protein [Roseomonas sp. HF4]